jgi:hypothetical protein
MAGIKNWCYRQQIGYLPENNTGLASIKKIVVL